MPHFLLVPRFSEEFRDRGQKSVRKLKVGRGVSTWGVKSPLLETETGAENKREEFQQIAAFSEALEFSRIDAENEPKNSTVIRPT